MPVLDMDEAEVLIEKLGRVTTDEWWAIHSRYFELLQAWMAR